MNKYLIFIALATTSAIAQKPLSSSNCDITLTVQGEGGTNGVSVAYNSSNQVYYTVFAGNAEYEIETHNISGTSISAQAIGFDVRGMWYNPTKKGLQGISYNNAGGFEVVLNSDGSVSGTKATTFSYGMDGQTVATYAAKLKSVMFVEGNTVSFFKIGKSKVKTVLLSSTEMEVSLNTNGPIYTGIKNYEIGLLESETMTIHLFSASSGKETGKVKLNSEACNSLVDFPDYFRVSYCNDRVFIFDTESRTWTGYKLF